MEQVKQTQNILSKQRKDTIYDYDKVLKASIDYFNGDELAATTWMNKYAMKDQDENFVELSREWLKNSEELKQTIN